MFSIYVYLLRVIIKFQKSLSNRSVDERVAQRQMRKDLRSLLAYPFIYILFSIPIFIYRIFEETYLHINSVHAFQIASVVLTPSLGAVNAVAFVLINANLKEISVALLKAGLRDIFRNIPGHAVTYNYHVNSVTRTSIKLRQYQPNEYYILVNV